MLLKGMQQEESRDKELEAFWAESGSNDTRGRSRIFCSTPTLEVQLDHFHITLLSWEFLLNWHNFL